MKITTPQRPSIVGYAKDKLVSTNSDGALINDGSDLGGTFAEGTIDKESVRMRSGLGEAHSYPGRLLATSGEDEKLAEPLETAEALHEIDEVYQAIEDVSLSLSEHLV